MTALFQSLSIGGSSREGSGESPFFSENWLKLCENCRKLYFYTFKTKQWQEDLHQQ